MRPTPRVVQTAYSFFTKQVQINYTLDIWGANWRNVESLDALRDQQIYQKQAAHLTLAANVAKAAIEEASLRGQIAATRRAIALEEERLALLQRQLAYGAVAGTDILSQQTALAQARQNSAAIGEPPRAAAQSADRARRPLSVGRSRGDFRAGAILRCRAICRSACPQSSSRSAPTSRPPRPIFIRRARRSASPSRRACRM